MKKIAFAAFASVAALSLAACGSETPTEEVTETTETLPDETMAADDMMTDMATDMATESAM